MRQVVINTLENLHTVTFYSPPVTSHMAIRKQPHLRKCVRAWMRDWNAHYTSSSDRHSNWGTHTHSTDDDDDEDDEFVKFFILLLGSCHVTQTHIHMVTHKHTSGFSVSGVTDNQQRSCCCGETEEGYRTGKKMKEMDKHILPLSDSVRVCVCVYFWECIFYVVFTAWC